MTRRGAAFLLLVLLAAGASLRAMEGFEGGLGAWTASGLWHRASGGCVTAHEGGSYVYLGRDNVCDYAGLNDNGARDARGQAIAALAGYRVQVAVTPQGWAGLAAGDVLRVRVTVTDPAGQALALDGFRTRY